MIKGYVVKYPNWPAGMYNLRKIPRYFTFYHNSLKHIFVFFYWLPEGENYIRKCINSKGAFIVTTIQKKPMVFPNMLPCFCSLQVFSSSLPQTLQINVTTPVGALFYSTLTVHIVKMGTPMWKSQRQNLK